MAVPAAETPLTPVAASQPSTQKVSDVIKSFRPSRQFTHLAKNESTEARITSLDFDDQGEFLVGASDDETMHVFDIKEGKKTKTVPSKKYGIHLARFTHHSRQVLYASTKVDDSLRLLELHNEGYVRYFTAHTKQVTCIALSPGNDQFISCADDDMVCLWDLNSRNPQGKLKLVTPYLAAYDPSATVMAIASQATASILLYDVRNYDKAPFATFDLAEAEGKYTPETRGRAWTKLEFSNDGKSMLLGTDYHGHFLLDAFEGNVKSFLIGRSGSTGRAAPVSSSGKPLGQGDACFSQEGRYVLGGAGEQPDILVWDTLEESDERGYLSPMTRLSSRGTKSVIVACNPRYNMFATADTKVTMWLPGEGSKETLHNERLIEYHAKDSAVPLRGPFLLTTLNFLSTFRKIPGMEDQPTPENAEISAGAIAVRALLDALLKRAETLLSEVTAFESFLHAQNRGKDAELRRFKSSVGAEKKHLQKLGDRLANSVFDPQHTGQGSLNREDLLDGRTLERFCPQPCSEVVDQEIAMDDSNVVAHSIDSSNLSWYETVWAIAKRCQGIKALQRSVPHSFQERNGLGMESLSLGVADRKNGKEKQRKQNVIVDIVAGDGLEWIKVVTITKKRLLFEMANEGWACYGGMSDSASDASGEDHSKESDDNGNSLKIVRLAQEMKNAASTVRVRYRHPKIRFILSNIEEGEMDEVDAVIGDIRAVGVGVYCGSGDDGRYVHSEAQSTSYLHLREEEDTDHMFRYMLPSTADPPPTSTLNIDCTILLSLISDISHIQKDSLLAIPARRYWKGVLKQVMAEATSPLLRDELYPILIGRDLVCTTEAVRRMREIAETMGTDVERKRADIFFRSGQMAGRSPEQLGLELKAYSAHAVPEGLRLPIKVVNFDLDAVLTGSTPAKHLPVPIANNVVNHKLCLSAINRSVFFYGWDAGIVTVTSNRVVTSQIEHAIVKAMDEAEDQTHRQRSKGGEDASTYSSGFGELATNTEEASLGVGICLGPDLWFSTPRSLVGKERGKDDGVDHQNTSGLTWENEMAE